MSMLFTAGVVWLALVALGECPDGGRFMVPHRGTDVSRHLSLPKRTGR